MTRDSLRIASSHGLVALALVIAGCASETATGMDAGTRDAGPEDANTRDEPALVDAGPDAAEVADASADAGPVEPTIGSERDALEGELATLGAMRDAVSPEVRATAGFLELELVLGELTAIVGKTGVLTAIVGKTGSMLRVSLPMPAIPALVAVRHLDRTIEAADALIARWLEDTRPEVIAVSSALATMRARAVSLRGMVATFLREVIDAVPAGTGRTTTEYTDDRSVDVARGTIALDLVGTGRAGDGEVVLSLECPGVTANVEGSVLDIERGTTTTLPLRFHEGVVVYPFTARIDDTNLLRATVTVPHDPFDWPVCRVTFTATRTVRGDLVDLLPSEEADLMTDRAAYAAAMNRLHGALAMLRSEGSGFDPEIVAVLEAYAARTSADSSLWRGQLTQYEIEDVELLELVVMQVLHARAAHVASAPQLADAQFGTALSAIAELQMLSEHAVGVLLP